MMKTPFQHPAKTRRTRIGILTLAMAALFAIAAIRLVALVAFDGARLDSMARSEHTAQTELAAPRGPIVDRNGNPLALSAETRSVYARPHRVLDSAASAELDQLAAALGMTRKELDWKLHKHAPFVWLARRIAPARARAAVSLGIDSVGALSEYKRFYPESNLAAAVVGLAGMDGQGLSGLELQYNRILLGTPVELHFYHDALGHPIFDSPLALRAPEPGAELKLTIDSSIQSVAETRLADEVAKSGATHGAAIVLDPFTGEVLAMANVSAVPDGIHDRLHNAAVQDDFEPGSTMKGILGSIALADRTITLDRQIYCEEGRFTIDRRTIHDDSPHGLLDLGGIIEVSSNIGAAKIALALGSDRFYDGLRAFGIGSRTGIDLPGEVAGILHPPSHWREIDLANHAFGQGVAVTPIQLATAYAAIANGGMIVRPYVVKAAYDAAGDPIFTHTPQPVRRAISPDVAHEMNLLLRGVVNGPNGTGHRAKVDGFTVAGKTGTAQMVDRKTGAYFQNRHVSSFVGFLPADDPRLVILVVLYGVGHGHFGGLVAAPVFSEIAEGAVHELDIVPPGERYAEASLIPSAAAGGSDADSAAASAMGDYVPVLTGSNLRLAAPDFAGMSLRSAFEMARKSRVAIGVKGGGYVIAQTPRAGAPIGNSPVELTLASPVAEADGGAITPAAYHSRERRSPDWHSRRGASEAR